MFILLFGLMQTEDLKIVIQVAELGNITKAAESLDLRVATASAAIKRVETQIGAEIFIRTTRRLRLSSAGERYIPICRQALLLLQSAHEIVTSDLGMIGGNLTISAPSDFGRNILLPWLDAIMDEHPALSIKLHISDCNIDFYQEGVDVALRYGVPKDSNLYGQKICDVPKRVCASEAYISNHAAVDAPGDLKHHKTLVYQLGNISFDLWAFNRNGVEQKVRVKRSRISNDGEVVKRWCVAGNGIAIKSCLDISDELLSGKLQVLLPDYVINASELWLVYPSRQSMTPTIRLLIEVLQAKCSDIIERLNKDKLIS